MCQAFGDTAQPPISGSEGISGMRTQTSSGSSLAVPERKLRPIQERRHRACFLLPLMRPLHPFRHLLATHDRTHVVFFFRRSLLHCLVRRHFRTFLLALSMREDPSVAGRVPGSNPSGQSSPGLFLGVFRFFFLDFFFVFFPLLLFFWFLSSPKAQTDMHCAFSGRSERGYFLHFFLQPVTTQRLMHRGLFLHVRHFFLHLGSSVWP